MTEKTKTAVKKTPTYSEPALKIVAFMKANAGRAMSLAEITTGAGVDNKSGYLASVRKILGADLTEAKDAIEVTVKVKRKVNAYTYTGEPSGDEFESEDTAEDATPSDEAN